MQLTRRLEDQSLDVFHLWGVLLSLGSVNDSPLETSTYRAEFSAMHTATEEIILIWYMLQSLSIPVKDHTKDFGNNISVLISSTKEGAELKKKHIALSFHMVHKAIAAEIIALHHITRHYNYANILLRLLILRCWKIMLSMYLGATHCAMHIFVDPGKVVPARATHGGIHKQICQWVLKWSNACLHMSQASTLAPVPYK